MTPMEVFSTLIGGAAAALVAYLTWRAPAWAVAMVVATVPLQAYATVGTEAAGVTWTQAWLWTFLAVGTALFAAGALAVRLDLVAVTFALVVACYALSRGQAVDEGRWLAEVYRWSAALAFFLVARGLLSARDATIPLVVVSAVGAVWTGGLAAAQVLGDVGPASFERAGVSRGYASFGEPNTFGAFAAACAIPLIALRLFGGRALSRPMATVCTVAAGFALLGLVLSQSRGALAASALVVGLLVPVRGLAVHRRPRLALAGAVVVASLVIAPRLVDEVLPPTDAVEVTTGSWADAERRAHWGAATRMVATTGGLGVGAGQFDLRYREHTPTWRFRIPQGHAHDAYLQVAAEAGVAGGVLYVSLIAGVLAILVRRAMRGGSSPLAGASAALTLGFAVHNLVDYLHVLNLPLILVAWWAAALGRSEGSS